MTKTVLKLNSKKYQLPFINLMDFYFWKVNRFFFLITENDFMLEFQRRSSNFANYTFPIDEMIVFTVCAWLKTKEQGTVFQYSNKDSRGKLIDVFITEKGYVIFTIHGTVSQ